MKPGETYHNTKVYLEGDVVLFSEISGDCNPVHMDIEYASKTIFGRRIVHGLLVGSQISSCISQIKGAIYMTQTLDFKAPVFIGDKITCAAIVDLIAEGKVYLTTVCVNQFKKTVIEGKAIIKIIKQSK